MTRVMVLSAFLILTIVPHVIASPLTGFWNLSDGIGLILDDENNGPDDGDAQVARDMDSNSSEGPGNEYYWRLYDMELLEKNISNFVDNGDGTASCTMETYKTGGTFIIHGDNLWGQTEGTIYEVSISNHYIGTSYFNWDGGKWVFSGATGSVDFWGEFKDDPFLFEMEYDINFDSYIWSDYYNHNVQMGAITNVVMNVSPVPEPATMFLFGTGLVGLVGFGRKKFLKG